MANPFPLLAGLFPYDPSIDTPLGNRNLTLIYCVVWGGQFAHGAYALYKGKQASKGNGTQVDNDGKYL